MAKCREICEMVASDLKENKLVVKKYSFLFCFYFYFMLFSFTFFDFIHNLFFILSFTKHIQNTGKTSCIENEDS